LKGDFDMNPLKRSPVLILIVLVALTGLAACGGSAFAPAATSTSTVSPVAGDFVGVTNNVDSIALSTNGQQLLAYAYDGTATHTITFSVWFKGAVSYNAVNLTAANGSHLVATLTAQAASGTVTLSSGHSFSFTAPAVNVTTGAGLYRGEETFAGVRYLGGWIIPTRPATISVPASGLLLSVVPQSTPTPYKPAAAGIINNQTGALLAWPALTSQDITVRQVTVPNLGTFTMKQCRQAQC
jgi:hypothetical protein